MGQGQVAGSTTRGRENSTKFGRLLCDTYSDRFKWRF
jgi:hypothetical protein